MVDWFWVGETAADIAVFVLLLVLLSPYLGLGWTCCCVAVGIALGAIWSVMKCCYYWRRR